MFPAGFDGAIIIHPQSSSVLRGQSVQFTCGTNNIDRVNWRFRSSLTRKVVEIVEADHIVNGFKINFMYARNETVNVLTHKNASMIDGGTYTCIEFMGTGETSAAELIVLGKYLKRS